MKKSYIIFTLIVLFVFLIGGVCFFTHSLTTNESNQETEENLFDGFVEQDLSVFLRYPETSGNDFTFGTYADLNKQYQASILDGILNIQDLDTKEEVNIQLENEKIVKIAFTTGCGMSEFYGTSMYVLTEKNNVYKSKDFEEESPLEITFSKVYDGEDISKSAEVDLVALSNQDGFITCLVRDVYLKVDDEVYTFDGQNYFDVVHVRNASIGNQGTLYYYFDGTIGLEEDGVVHYIQDTNGKKVSFLLLGMNENQGYLLDQDGNEYFFDGDYYSYFYSLTNYMIVSTNEGNLLKVSKKGTEYLIQFMDNETRHITSEDYNNVFSNIK